MTKSVEPISPSLPVPSRKPDEAGPAAGLRCGPLPGCAAALLAGLLTWGLTRAVFPVFDIPEELKNLPSPQPSHLAVKAERAQIEADRWNATVLFAVLGLTVAGGLAVAECLVRGPAAAAWWRALLSGSIAGLLGAAGGLSASLLLESPQHLAGLSPLARTISVQCLGLGLAGLGIGLGVGTLGGGRVLLNAAVGGVLAGGLVGFVYPTAMGYLLPAAQTERVVPLEATSQLIWLAAIAGISALVITGLGKKDKRAAQ